MSCFIKRLLLYFYVMDKSHTNMDFVFKIKF